MTAPVPEHAPVPERFALLAAEVLARFDEGFLDTLEIADVALAPVLADLREQVLAKRGRALRIDDGRRGDALVEAYDDVLELLGGPRPDPSAAELDAKVAASARAIRQALDRASD